MVELSADNILEYLANTPQITFEITERCNLSCIYCGYGKLYANRGERKNRDLPIAKAIRFLNILRIYGSWEMILKAIAISLSVFMEENRCLTSNS